MKKFITTRPEAGLSGFGSPYDPVLAGVAQGLARLFPPLEGARLVQGGRAGKAGDAAASRAGETTDAGARG